MRRQGLFIDGTWRATSAENVVRSPWDDTQIGTYAVAGAADVAEAIDAAARAHRAGLPAFERARILESTSAAIAARAEELSATLSAEAGKPLTTARAEVGRAETVLRLAADEARRLPSETVQLDAFQTGAGLIAFTIPEGRGVVGAITPFNFPLNLVLHKVAPAIAAGCPVVLKPSERTPLTAGLMLECFVEGGLPAGWLNLVTGDPAQIVGALQDDDRVAVLTFTGSSKVGWAIKAASPHKHHILELGSNAALIVDESADLDAAVSAVVTSGFGYSGQTCVSVQRVFVHDSVIDDFSTRLARAASALRAGDPSDEATVIGPLISDDAVARISDWVADAVAEGAQVLAGGNASHRVVPATVLRDVVETSPLITDEVFGPVVSVASFSSVGEAFDRANSSRFGINVSLFTNDLTNALAWARTGEAGTVLINMTTGFRSDLMPYGGVKDSGQGKEGVKYAVAEYTHQKLVVLAPANGQS